MKPVLAIFTVIGPIIWCDNPQVRLWIILYADNNDFHHLGRSQMCTGACYYFSPSKPRSGTLCAAIQPTCAAPCRASCPCPRRYDPLCGSDGQTYSNECAFRCHKGRCPYKLMISITRSRHVDNVWWRSECGVQYSKIHKEPYTNYWTVFWVFYLSHSLCMAPNS